MTDGVFNNEPPAENTPADPQIDPAIQKRLMDKDAFIEQLERENAEMREAVRQAELDREAKRVLEEARKAATPPPSREAPQAAQEPAKSVDPDELVERVLEAQEKRTAAAQAKANAQAAADKLVELFGTEDAANKVVRERAAELGVGTDFLLSTAQRSPAAFFELMKIDEAPKNAPAPRNDVNPAALKNHAPGAVKPGTPEYYEQLRKEIGNTAFYTPKIQQQRFKDLQAYYANQR